jgi:phosphopentomutase
MARAILLVMDSVGIGGASDAAKFGDEGADTLGHLAAACAEGRADQPGLRSGPLKIPVMNSLGICRAAEASAGTHPKGIERIEKPSAIWAYASEVSKGKDTQSGHWELAGLPVPFEWGYFPNTIPTFPKDLTDRLIAEANLPGILGNRHASGTDVIDEFGEEHIRTGKPICYTSADSVFQICAHEKHFGLERLYEVCKIGRKLCDPLRIGRVIARPFVGEKRGEFKRTGNRKDIAVPPPGETLLDLAVSMQRDVFGVGKISDIFTGRGVTKVLKAPENESQFNRTLEAISQAKDGDLVFTNLIDFDQLFGHRRDSAGYADCLEKFDRRLPELIAALKPGDLVILTADHGNDPTYKGSDHTRENIPVMAFGPKIEGRNAGHLHTYADVAQTIAGHLAIPPLKVGASFM